MKRSMCVAAAFSLVEVTLALGIGALCLITVFALVPVAVLTNRNATSQTATANIMAAVVADLRATPAASSTSSQFAITFGTCKKLYFNTEGQVLASAACDQAITVPPTSRYQLNITWNTSNLTGSCSPALPCADLKATWPAAATPANATGSTEVSAAFDRN